MRLLTAIALFYIFFTLSLANAAGLKISESSINFGNLKEGPPVEKVITLTNEGSETVTIANTVSSCACTSVKLSSTTLEPGANAELLITYSTYKYPGKFDKIITIFTGAGGEEETVIHILGYVDPIPMGKIKVNPRKTPVGDLTVNSGNEVQIVIKNVGDAPLTISRIYSSKFKTEYFNAEVSGSIKISAGQEHKVDLVVTPQKPGRFLDTILIYSDARNDIGKGYKALLSGTTK